MKLNQLLNHKWPTDIVYQFVAWMKSTAQHDPQIAAEFLAFEKHLTNEERMRILRSAKVENRYTVTGYEDCLDDE